jgi:hypothetical protein
MKKNILKKNKNKNYSIFDNELQKNAPDSNKRCIVEARSSRVGGVGDMSMKAPVKGYCVHKSK